MNYLKPLAVIAIVAIRLSLPRTTTAQILPIGARANALGFAASCLSDEWGVFNNPGGTAGNKSFCAGFTTEVHPEFPAFNRYAAVMIVPVKIGVAGMGIYRFGDDLYNEHIASCVVGSKFGLASLGLRMSYVQYNIQGFGRKGLLGLSFGGIAELSRQLCVGAYISNLYQPYISAHEDQRLPAVLTAGVSFKPSEKLFLTTEIQKDIEFSPTWKTALEYQVHKKVIGRTGFNLHPNAGFMGFGFRAKKFSLDYAYTLMSFSGSRHQASVGYNLHAKAK